MPYRRTTVVSWSLYAMNAASLLISGKPLLDEYVMIVFINIMVWTQISHYVYYVLQDFTRVLNIKVFTIKPKIVDPEPADNKKKVRTAKKKSGIKVE